MANSPNVLLSSGALGKPNGSRALSRFEDILELVPRRNQYLSSLSCDLEIWLVGERGLCDREKERKIKCLAVQYRGLRSESRSVVNKQRITFCNVVIHVALTFLTRTFLS